MDEEETGSGEETEETEERAERVERVERERRKTGIGVFEISSWCQLILYCTSRAYFLHSVY
jgi:hypothetical protein